MNGKSTLVGLLGLGLLGAHFVTSPDGKTIRESISNADNPPPTDQAHAAIAKFGGLLLFVIVATIASAGSDSAGTLFIGFFALLWVIWGMKNTASLNSLTGKNFPLPTWNPGGFKNPLPTWQTPKSKTA